MLNHVPRPRPHDVAGLCERCQHRADSRRRAAEHGPLGADPAPRFECKQHEGYHREPANVGECREFTPVES